MTTERQDSYHRSFVAMRNALRSILFNNSDCMRSDEPKNGSLCECPICIARWALENEEDWRFMGWRPERRVNSPRELAMVEALKHYFKRSAGKANGTTAPMDDMLAGILGVDADSVSERDWYIVTTIVQWLATNVGQCVLSDAGYEYKSKPVLRGKHGHLIDHVNGARPCEDCGSTDDRHPWGCRGLSPERKP